LREKKTDVRYWPCGYSNRQSCKNYHPSIRPGGDQRALDHFFNYHFLTMEQLNLLAQLEEEKRERRKKQSGMPNSRSKVASSHVSFTFQEPSKL
jgi:hypothetical protein